VLSKPVCDKYLEESTLFLDSPWFFNGRDDGWDYYCVTQSSLIEGNCANMETNSIITDSKGKEIKLCNDAPTTVHYITGYFTLFYLLLLFICLCRCFRRSRKSIQLEGIWMWF
jgi:hypothetical protein